MLYVYMYVYIFITNGCVPGVTNARQSLFLEASHFIVKTYTCVLLGR